MTSHPVDQLPVTTPQDEINMTAAFLGVVDQYGTVLGVPPPESLENKWTVAMCHRWVLSLKHAYSSRDPSGEVWRRFVTAWERAHLERSDYFNHHARAYPTAESRSDHIDA